MVFPYVIFFEKRKWKVNLIKKACKGIEAGMNSHAQVLNRKCGISAKKQPYVGAATP